MKRILARWYVIRRGWRIAITCLAAVVVLLGGTYGVLYLRSSLARDFNRTLTGVAVLTASNDPALVLSEAQLVQILVPLRSLEIQLSIDRPLATQALADIRSALTPEQRTAIAELSLSRLGLAAGGPSGGGPGGGGLGGGGLGGDGTGTTGAAGSGTAGTGRAGILARFGRGGGALGAGRQGGRLGQLARRPLIRLLAPVFQSLPTPDSVARVTTRLTARLDQLRAPTVTTPTTDTPK